MASRKVDFALAVRAGVTALAEAAERIAELDAMYGASEYDELGSNSIVDGDIEGHDITAQNLVNASTFAFNLALFLGGGDPMEFDYISAINAFRGM